MLQDKSAAVGVWGEFFFLCVCVCVWAGGYIFARGDADAALLPVNPVLGPTLQHPTRRQLPRRAFLLGKVHYLGRERTHLRVEVVGHVLASWDRQLADKCRRAWCDARCSRGGGERCRIVGRGRRRVLHRRPRWLSVLLFRRPRMQVCPPAREPPPDSSRRPRRRRPRNPPRRTHLNVWAGPSFS